MGFADLTPLDRLQPDIRPVRKSVIKSLKARGEKISKFELPNMESDKPTIMVRQADESGDTLEFICTCGCTTTVRLEFDPATGKNETELQSGKMNSTIQDMEAP